MQGVTARGAGQAVGLTHISRELGFKQSRLRGFTLDLVIAV